MKRIAFAVVGLVTISVFVTNMVGKALTCYPLAHRRFRKLLKKHPSNYQFTLAELSVMRSFPETAFAEMRAQATFDKPSLHTTGLLDRLAELQPRMKTGVVGYATLYSHSEISLV